LLSNASSRSGHPPILLSPVCTETQCRRRSCRCLQKRAKARASVRRKEIRSYKVALGSEPVGPKTQHGDHRTPEGVYTLDSRNPNSHFYKAFHISYPSPKDIATAKKLGISPGGDIMLHGLPKEYAWVGKAHTLHDWTDGCIAVMNEEMDELWKLGSGRHPRRNQALKRTTVEIRPLHSKPISLPACGG